MSLIFNPNNPFKTNEFVDNEFFLRVELYYAQPPQHNFVRAANSAEIMKEEVGKICNKFKCVQTKLFQINRSLNGLSTFVPIQFDREYTSLCMFTLHSSIIDFKFYSPSTANTVRSSKRQLLAMASDDEDERESLTYVENGILVEYKDLGDDDEKGKGQKGDKSREKSKPMVFQPHNITEYLFFNERGQPDLSEESIAQAYQSYTTLLANAHKQLRQNYISLAEAAYANNESIKQGIDPPIPLSVDPIKTNSLQSYLE